MMFSFSARLLTLPEDLQKTSHFCALRALLWKEKGELHEELRRGVTLQVLDEDQWDGSDYFFAKRIGTLDDDDDDDSVPELNPSDEETSTTELGTADNVASSVPGNGKCAIDGLFGRRQVRPLLTSEQLHRILSFLHQDYHLHVHDWKDKIIVSHRTDEMAPVYYGKPTGCVEAE